MAILISVLSLVATIGCFVSPSWAQCAYVIMNVVRPNENVMGVLYPTIPVIIVVAAAAYLIHQPRQLPPPAGLKQPEVPLIIAMLMLILVHHLIWRRPELVQWVLAEFAPVLMLVLYATRHMATPQRTKAQFMSLLAGASFISVQALMVHYLFKGSRRMVQGVWDLRPSYGEVWDSFHLYGGTFEKVEHWRLKGRGDGVFGNSNDLGMVCNWAIAGGLYLLRRKGSVFLRLFGGAIVGVGGWVIELAGSRGSMLQALVTVWMVFMGNRRRVLGAMLLVAGLAGVLFVLPALVPQRSDAGESTSERLMLLRDAFNFFIHNPVKGIGYMNFPDVASKTLMPHNVYMQCLAETGLLGSVPFFAMLFFLRRNTRRSLQHLWQQHPNENITRLAESIAALQLSFMVFMLFTNQFMRFTMALVLTPAMPLYRWVVAEQNAAAEGGTSGADSSGASSGDSGESGRAADRVQYVYDPLGPEKPAAKPGDTPPARGPAGKE